VLVLAAAFYNIHVGQAPHTPAVAVLCYCWCAQCLVLAAKDDVQRKEQLVLINTRLLALCTAHDSVAADTEKLEAAAEVYRDLLSSVRQQHWGWGGGAGPVLWIALKV
jgi:tryptophan synthase beta subunit